MLFWKKIDVYGQFSIIIICLILILISEGGFLLYSYFIVGSWQVTSTFIQLCFNEIYPEARDRRRYQYFLLIAAATLPLGSFWVLPVISPFTAIWYLHISYRELACWQVLQDKNNLSEKDD